MTGVNDAATLQLSDVTTAPSSWPPEAQHCVAMMDLKVDSVRSELRELLPSIYELAALGDAIRALQTSDGNFLDEHVAAGLLQKSAILLEEISSSLPFPAAEALRLRAKGLTNVDAYADAVTRQAQVNDEPLNILCGPLSTWRTKSKGTLHSVVVSAPVDELNTLVAEADSFLSLMEPHLRAELDEPELKMGAVPPFVVTTLVACGGEANTLPKHFSYFLPEDEGVKRAPSKKTVVYADLYHERYRRVSTTLYSRLCKTGASANLAPERSMQGLLLWFRGHDFGHSFVLPNTSFSALRPLGRETSIMLQEAIADVLGYLVSVKGPWEEAFQVNTADGGAIFLAELLRYVRRGPEWFPDSGAAFLELSYLVHNGYVSIEDGGGALAWDPAQLYEGMLALAKDLVNIVLRADLTQGQRMLDAHVFRAQKGPATGLLAKLQADFKDVPTAFAYRPPGSLSRHHD